MLFFKVTLGLCDDNPFNPIGNGVEKKLSPNPEKLKSQAKAFI